MKNYYLAFSALVLSILSADTNKILIEDLSLQGNINVSRNEIFYIIRQRPPNFFFRRPEFDPRLLKLDAFTLENYYKSKGFLDAEVEEFYEIKEDQYAHIKLKVNEGKQYFLSNVSISGNEIIDRSEIIESLRLKMGQPYNPVAINENLYLLENKYHNMGKLFFSISIQDVISDSVDVKIEISEGDDIYINSTYFQELGDIDSSIILREITYNSGDKYSKFEIDRTSNRIRELGVFSMANFIPVKVANSDTIVNMIAELKKYKQREWNSSGGLDPISFAEGTPDLPALSATIEWRNRSIFNTPKQFSTKLLAGIPVETDFITPRIRYDASLSSNWFFGIRIPTKITGYYERFIRYEDRTYKGSITRSGSNLRQRLKIDDRSYFENKIVWESFSDSSIQTIQERSILLKILLDHKDDPLFTKNGYLIDLIVKTAGFGGSREYYKTDLTVQSYLGISEKTVTAMRIQIGKIWNWNYDDDFSFEKFYLGGSTSMRAWDVLMFQNLNEKTDGGIFRFMTNIEVRRNIYKMFGVTFFADAGLLTDVMPAAAFSALNWDVGMGLSLNTPLGPARLDYAVQLDNINENKVQLGVQYLF